MLALDMYEHAYHIDFGANAKAYVDIHERRPLGLDGDRGPDKDARLTMPQIV